MLSLANLATKTKMEDDELTTTELEELANDEAQNYRLYWHLMAPQLVPDGWVEFFQENAKILKMIRESLDVDVRANLITPKGMDIFTAFFWTPDPREIKAVIIAQDPYQSLGADDLPRAVGAAFSQREADWKVTPSLKVIYKELAETIPDFETPNHGCLESWARQGVFLLNAALTTQLNKSGAHKIHWKVFLERLLAYIERVNPDFCYIMWGRDAQSVKANRKRQQFHAVHPAYEARGKQGFNGCNHFQKVNDYLSKTTQFEPINWSSICYKVCRAPTKNARR